MKTIILFRHGETDWNSQMRMQGSTNIPLNEAGFRQAHDLKLHLKDHSLDLIFASDLIRSQQTAQVIAQEKGLTILQDPRVREANLGAIEGLTRDEVILNHGEDMWARWRSADENDWHHRFPQAESKMEVFNRMQSFFEELKSRSESKIAICSHGGAMRVYLTKIFGARHLPDLIPNCAAFSFV